MVNGEENSVFAPSYRKFGERACFSKFPLGSFGSFRSAAFGSAAAWAKKKAKPCGSAKYLGI